MATQYTPILKLALPGTGELAGTWGDVVNNNITSMIEQAIAGAAAINTWTGASHTLTTANGTTSESRCAILECSGAPGAAAEVICPTQTKFYIIANAVTGGYTVTLKTATGTGIAVPNGKAMLLYCNGTNVVEGVNYVATANNVSGTVAIGNGGTGQTTQQTAINALTGAQSSGKYLRSDGTNATLSSLAAADMTGSIAIANGGTGQTTQQTAINALTGTQASGKYLRSDGTNATLSSLAAGDMTGTLALANGGTGQTTAQAAMNSFAGAVTSGSYLRGNGTNVVMSTIQAADVPTLNQNTTGTAANVTGTVAIANGGTGATTAATARTNLGATTVGGNMYTLTNPSAITFPRFNADNTVSALDAATFRTAIGAGTGGGSVTSVGGTGTVNGITLSGTVTTTGNITLGGTLSGVSLTTQVTGTLPIANGGTGQTTATQALAALHGFTTTVSSASVITLTATSAYQQEITGTTAQTITLPVASTLTAGWAVEVINNSTANITVNSSGGNLVGTIVPNTSGNFVCVLNSGTTAASWDFDIVGFASRTGTGSVVMSTSPTLVTPALGTPTSGTLTSCTGLPLTTGVTGTLPVANGGTGATTLTANNVILGNGTSAVQVVAPGTSGNVLTSDGTTWVSQALSADPIGTFKEFAGDTTTTYPGSSWLRCAGGIVSQSTYSSLYAKLGLLANSTTTTDTTIRGATVTGTPAVTNVTYGDGVFAFSTTSGYYTSTDGNSWSVSAASNINVSYGTTNLWIAYQTPSIATSTSASGPFTTIWTDPNSWVVSGAQYNPSAPTDKYVRTESTFGGLYSSTNGITWTGRTLANIPVKAVRNGITFAYSGTTLYTSTDNITFTNRTTNITSAIRGLTYASNQTNKYAIFGNSGALCTSTDAITWTARTSGTAGDITALAYDGTKFWYFDSNQAVGTSTDGVTWTLNAGYGPYMTTTIAAGAYGAGGTVAVCSPYSLNCYQDIYSSVIASPSYTDSSFVYDTTNNQIVSFASRWTTAGNSYVATSTNNGTSWTAKTGSAMANPITPTNVAFSTTATEKYLVGGTTTGQVGFIKSSTDATTWTTRTFASGMGSVNTMTYGSGVYVVGGYGATGSTGYLQTSTDGITWTARASNFPSAGANGVAYVNSVIYAADQTYKFTLLGYTNSGSPSYTNVYYYNTSTDGITWGTPTSFGNPSYSPRIVYGNGMFVRFLGANTANSLEYSLDGVTWYTGVNAAITGTVKLVYGNGLFTCGSLYSWDGRNWASKSGVGATFSAKTNMITVGNYGLLTGFNKFSYNSATDFALPTQVNILTQGNTDKLYIKAL